MTYCLGIMTRQGLVMASDSRTNAGYDDVNVCRKMHQFVRPGERAFILLCSGSLSLSQSVMTLLDRDFKQGKGLAAAPTMYDAARVIGEQVRRVAALDRRGPGARRLPLQRPLHPGRPDPRRAARAVPDLPAGQPAVGRGGIALSADRRVQVRPADPRPRRPLRPDLAGGGGQIRPDLARLDDALQRDGRAADRPGPLRAPTSCRSRATAGSARTTRTCGRSTCSGSRLSASRCRSCRPCGSTKSNCRAR